MKSFMFRVLKTAVCLFVVLVVMSSLMYVAAGAFLGGFPSLSLGFLLREILVTAAYSLVGGALLTSLGFYFKGL